MKPSLSIIVPYRDRLEHLRRFVPHIQRYFARDKLDRDIPYSLTIVEQANQSEFNAGLLRNIGFALTRENHDYFCFHDVDYLPIWADYSCPASPARVIWHGADKRPRDAGQPNLLRHDYQTFFGAVVMLGKYHFQQVNGYSNGYPGWGYEDADLRERCRACGLDIELRDGTFEALTHPNRGHTPDMKPNATAIRNRRRFFEQFPPDGSRQRGMRDGLSDLEYKVVEAINLDPVQGERRALCVRIVRVDFGFALSPAPVGT